MEIKSENIDIKTSSSLLVYSYELQNLDYKSPLSLKFYMHVCIYQQRKLILIDKSWQDHK